MKTIAVVLEQPEHLLLSQLDSADPATTTWSSTSNGAASAPAPRSCCGAARMPAFPGMGYPLVPGYESVGRVVEAGRACRAARSATASSCRAPTASATCAACSAARRRASWCRASAWCRSTKRWANSAMLLALAATAYHAVSGGGKRATSGAARPDRRPRRARPPAGAPERGRRLHRHRWSGRPTRSVRQGAEGYTVLHPDDDPRRDYRAIYDVSGDAAILDTLIAPPGAGRRDRARRLLQRARVLLLRAGLHARGADPRRRRMAAPRPAGREAELIESGVLSLDGLITHHDEAAHADARLPHRLRRSRPV